MKNLPLDYSRIPGHPKLFLEFLRFDSVQQFYSPYHQGCPSLAELARIRQRERFPRREISAALYAFNQRIENHPAALANARKLAEEGTLAVVTGQQAGIFGGAALTFYKAITAILFAQKLSAEGIPAVPLFWVASEDHDFQEISRTTFLGREAELLDLKIENSADRPLTAAQRKVGGHTALVQRLEELIGGMDHARQVLEWIGQSYRPERSLSEAFARLLASVLGPNGLVMLDASDPAVRRLSSPYYLRAVEQAERIHQVLQSRVQELRNAGFEPQAHWEKDYTLLFHLTSDGRHAIRRTDGRFTADEVCWTAGELEQEISEHPERFSPSALLRPVVQDAILPTAFYVGGPAEVAYFAQVQALAEVYGWTPVIQTRLSATLIDPRACRYLERNDLEVTDLFCSLEALREKIALKKLHPDVLDAWNERSQKARRELDSMFEVVARFDPTVASAWNTSRKKIHYQLEKIQKKLLRAAAEKSQLVKSQALFLHHLVYPGEVLQERRINFLSFYAHFGPSLMQRLFSLSPCEKFSHVVTLQ